MKLKIKNHFQRETHIKALQTFTCNQKMRKKNITRDQKVGETLGLLVYDITNTAKPDTAYEDQISLLSMLNVDVGEINHSRMFPAKFVPYLANNIDNNIKAFFLQCPWFKLGLDQHSKLLLIRLLIVIVQDNSLELLQ